MEHEKTHMYISGLIGLETICGIILLILESEKTHLESNVSDGENGENPVIGRIEISIRVLEIFEKILIVGCSLDIVLSIIAFGSKYFSKVLNVMDFCIITISWIFIAMNKVKFVRIIMLVRFFNIGHIRTILFYY